MKIKLQNLILPIAIATALISLAVQPFQKAPRVALLFVALIFSLIGVASLIREKKIPKKTKRITVSITTVFAVLVILEIAFTFVTRSQGYGQALSSLNWRLKYWNPTLNSEGFRDRDLNPEVLKVRKSVLVIGDTMISGQGIDETKDRATDLLESKLGKTWIVVNRALSGVNTEAELEMARTYANPYQYLVLGYFGNDIDTVAKKHHLPMPKFGLRENENSLYRWFIQRSFLINYFYWSFPRDYSRPYLDYLKTAYNDEEIRKDHFSDLDQFAKLAKTKKVPFAIVLFPFLAQLDESFFVDRVKAHFKGKNVKIIDVKEQIQSWPVDQRIINRNDNHPSLRVHALVAEKLYEWISSSPQAP